MKNEQIGVILLNLGGPETLSDVAPFLFNLFSDRDIIRLGPAWLQRPLARLLAYRRAAKSRKNYALIGGGSPLTRITMSQQQALQKALDSHGAFKVVTGMRYWKPRVKSALQLLVEQKIARIIALPLYPHYSSATTGSSLTELKNEIASSKAELRLLEITAWPDHPLYISCLSGYIQKGLAGLSGPETSLVYSAHSLPAELVEQGDPYVTHLQKTITAVESQTNHRGLLCFQSRSGPVRWLTPSTPDTLDKLAAQGCKNILIVPISFVSDHVETLYEINILYKQKAHDLGMRLTPTQSLNTDPVFIDCLCDLVMEKAKEFK